jgi:hypothetical protein
VTVIDSCTDRRSWRTIRVLMEEGAHIFVYLEKMELLPACVLLVFLFLMIVATVGCHQHVEKRILHVLLLAAKIVFHRVGSVMVRLIA